MRAQVFNDVVELHQVATDIASKTRNPEDVDEATAHDIRGAAEDLFNYAREIVEAFKRGEA